MNCEETIEVQSDSYLIDPDELKKRIAGAGDLIMLPTVAVEAMELANDPDCSIPAFVQVIETDLRISLHNIRSSSHWHARRFST